ncbi:MAG: hypothetical protein WA428_12880 [Candidatus Cybelea sp.]
MDEDNAQRGESEGHTYGDPAPPSVVWNVTGPNTERQTQGADRDSEDKGSPNFFQKLEAWSAFLLVLITLGYTFVSKCTLDTMQGQTGAAIRSADAAATAANVASDTLNNAQNDFVAEQRPYVGVTLTAFLPIALNKGERYQFIAPLSMINYGKSPAEYVWIAWKVSRDPRGWADKNADWFFATSAAQWNWTSMGDLAPGTTSALQSTGALPYWGPYPRGYAQKIGRIRDGLAVFGRVRYEDAQRNQYYTDFCIASLGAGPASDCKYHNYFK